MATWHDDSPYGQFNFRINLGTGDTAGYQAGFQEVSGFGSGVTISAPRSGDSEETTPTRITSVIKASEVTLKRGVIDAAALYEWLDQVRNGGPSTTRTVTISRQDPNHTGIVQTWKLSRARIVKHASGNMKAKGTDVALEELVLAHEGLEIE